jgi:hypothetical protein
MIQVVKIGKQHRVMNHLEGMGRFQRWEGKPAHPQQQKCRNNTTDTIVHPSNDAQR